MLIAQAADPALEQPTIDTTELVARGEPLVVDSEAGKSLDTKDPNDYGDYYSKKGSDWEWIWEEKSALKEGLKYRWLRKGEREKKRLAGEQTLLRNSVCIEANINVIRLNLIAPRTCL